MSGPQPAPAGRTLVVESASFAYDAGVPVLRDVSVAARPGEMLAVTGTSGAGKSTLLNAMAGLLASKEGRVLLDGQPVGDRDHAVALGVVLVPQDNGLAAILTAAENIVVAMIATGATPAEARRGTADALDRLGLTGQGDQLIEELSGGQQQRGGDRARAGVARRRAARRRGHQRAGRRQPAAGDRAAACRGRPEGRGGVRDARSGGGRRLRPRTPPAGRHATLVR